MMLRWEPVISLEALQKATGIDLADCEFAVYSDGQDYVRFDCDEETLAECIERLELGNYCFEQELVNEIQLIKAIRDEFGDMEYIIIDMES